MRRQLVGGSGGGRARVSYATSGAHEFTHLIDTPANYTGNANKAVYVNAGETALEFLSSLKIGTLGGDPPSIADTFILYRLAGEDGAIFVMTPTGKKVIPLGDV